MAFHGFILAFGNSLTLALQGDDQLQQQRRNIEKLFRFRIRTSFEQILQSSVTLLIYDTNDLIFHVGL